MTTTSHVTDIELPYSLRAEVPRDALIEEVTIHTDAAKRFHAEALATEDEHDRASVYLTALGRLGVAVNIAEQIEPIDVDSALDLGLVHAQLSTDAKRNHFDPASTSLSSRKF